CPGSDAALLARAFHFVSGFNVSWFYRGTPSQQFGCWDSPVTEIRLPARNLTGTVSWKFLANITRLRAVDLSGNYLTGSLPPSIWLVPSLAEFNLSHNRLGGAAGLPRAGFPAVGPVRSIDVSFNRFKSLGFFSDFVNLTNLDVSGNDFAAVLPFWFANFTNLEFLAFAGCNFSG
ncbi:hypothetical protein M569_04028, partial [Genlisea aurea]